MAENTSILCDVGGAVAGPLERVAGPWFFLPAGEFGLTNGPFTWNVEEVMAQRVCPPKMMLGFVIRRCAVALGHSPTPAELVEWANNQRDTRGRYKIFGRAITVEDARVIMKHPGRLVTVRGAWPGVAA